MTMTGRKIEMLLAYALSLPVLLLLLLIAPIAMLLAIPPYGALSYPPDTDTPGYQTEQESKPKACHLISETAGLFKAEDVARVMVQEALKPSPKFSVYFGLEGWMLATLTAGMSPESSLLDTVCQVGLMGLIRLLSNFFLNDFWDICRHCHEEPQTDNYQSIN